MWDAGRSFVMRESLNAAGVTSASHALRPTARHAVRVACADGSTTAIMSPINYPLDMSSRTIHGEGMYSGDEMYGDEITSGPETDEQVTCAGCGAGCLVEDLVCVCCGRRTAAFYALKARVDALPEANRIYDMVDEDVDNDEEDALRAAYNNILAERCRRGR